LTSQIIFPPFPASKQRVGKASSGNHPPKVLSKVRKDKKKVEWSWRQETEEGIGVGVACHLLIQVYAFFYVVGT